MIVTMTAMTFRRLIALPVALVIGAYACGGTAAEPELSATTTTSRAQVSTTSQAPAVSSTTTTTTTTSTTTVPVDPYETFVATIREEVTVLETFETPDGEPVTFEFAITNPTFFDNPLALMITDRSDDERWLRVQIPVRPNGTEAWIRIEDADVTSHRFSAEVNLTDRAVTVWDGETVVAQTTAVIGKETSPTPLGSFFVNDLIEKWDGSAYGPSILSLSGFSEAMATFGGGGPVIAIHGTNRPELMGGAHSNGCIRIPNNVIELLAETVPIGTPVDIVA